MRPKGPNPVDMLVGSRIRLLRKRRKMSQAELGKALGVTFQQVQKYENGKNRVGASRLHLVATALDVPVSEFFAGAAETSSYIVRDKVGGVRPAGVSDRGGVRQNLRQGTARLAD